MSDRFQALSQWVTGQLGDSAGPLEPLSADASSRRYWRVQSDDGTLVAMDAPPATEDSARFVAIARAWRGIGLNTPEIHAADLERGFLLIGDLGDQSYLGALSADTADRLYGDALEALAIIQADAPTAGLPPYDAAFLRRELGLFETWLLEAELGLQLSEAERAGLREAEGLLIASALEQPWVCVHRDYHSRNLMVTARGNPGLLDFQDAVLGPVTYDLVSLLRDCYIDWPAERVTDWALGYFHLARQSGVLREEDDPDRFLRWLDLMGAQRHLKASGIFARLNRRDGRPAYLADLPRTLGYVATVARAYDGLGGLARLLEERVLPALPALACPD